MLTDKFPVCQKALDAFNSGQPDKMIRQLNII
jgi:hypothetical protein